MAAVLLLFTILASLSSISADCGFPGYPLNGFVEVPVGECYQAIDETNWTRHHLDAVVYRCHSKHLLIYSERKYRRECVNGRWTGHIPQCASREELEGVIEAMDCEKPTGYDCYGKLKVLPLSYKVELNSMRRLSGALMEHDSNCRKNVSYNVFVDRAETVDFWKNVPAHQINGDNYTILTFASRYECFSNLGIQPKSGETKELFVTRAELLTLNDNCGHPEIPINGHVRWRINDTIACYSCDEGYSLIANSNIRRCIRGSWDGFEPICVPMTRDVPVIATTRTTVVQGNTTPATTTTTTPTTTTPTTTTPTTTTPTTTTPTTTTPTTTTNIPATTTTTATTTPTTTTAANTTRAKCVEANSTAATTTLVKCGRPKLLNNSDIVWNGTTVTYFCHEGYKLTSNSSTMRCVNGKWTGPVPTCERTVKVSGVLSGGNGNGSMVAIIVGTCCGLLIIAIIVALVYNKKKSGKGEMGANYIKVKPKKTGGNKSKRMEISPPRMSKV